MSWIVQTLVRNQLSIKSTNRIDSDFYTDLLVVEGAIERMSREGLLSDMDKEILDNVVDGSSMKVLGEILKRPSKTVSKHFNLLCERIGEYLGGQFTDDGYLDMMRETYSLTEEQVEKARDYMKSKYRHRISRSVN